MTKQLSNILLGVTGGIAAYKSPDLVRRLQDKGFKVRVVMSKAAENFITAMTLQAVSGHPVNQDLFDNEAEAAMGHIDLAKWADIILIAPATANCLSKVAYGMADDLLTTLILASNAELFVAPAMNQQMWKNKAIISNVELLKQRGIHFLGPDAGEQACGDMGFGRMREPDRLADAIATWAEKNVTIKDLAKKTPLSGCRWMITAGPTIEAIDPVRYLSNHSSGKMGYAIAEAAVDAGAEVTLVSGPVRLGAPCGVKLIKVESAKDMLTAVKKGLSECDVFVGCAAVADYAPRQVAGQKIKKSDKAMQLDLVRNPDIIAWVGQQAKPPFIVGFAAESEKLEAYAKSKLKEKNMDMICANDISDQSIGFNSDYNAISLFTSSGEEKKMPVTSKSEIAKALVSEVAKSLKLK